MTVPTVEIHIYLCIICLFIENIQIGIKNQQQFIKFL